jgi:uncharacterized protein (TIGR02757 family)
MNLSLKRKLDYHYRYFGKNRISPDPLEILHKYSKPEEIEIIGFIASLFSYGNVTQIINTLGEIEKIIDQHPYDFILNFNKKNDGKYFNGLKHRFYTEEDIVSLFEILHQGYLSYANLKELFLLYYFEEEPNLKNSISCFSKNLMNLCVHCDKKAKVTSGLKFMLPDPLKGSACKRMNLFLRWMIRKDDLDFGLWKEIPPSKLVIPVDTHVARICRELKLTNRKNISWKMAEEITNKLRKFDPVDPVKYDFAICHIGMRKMKF